MGEAHPSDALKHISCYKNIADMFMCVPNKNCYWYVKHFFKMSLELISKALFYFIPTTCFYVIFMWLKALILVVSPIRWYFNYQSSEWDCSYAKLELAEQFHKLSI